MPIKLKRSAVSGKAPVTTDLDLGELALNTFDGKLYTKKNNGTESIIEIGGDAVTSVAGKTGAVTLAKADVGLGNVDNTSDTNKPISTATQTALNAKANTTHSHAISDVTDLETSLNQKVAVSGSALAGGFTATAINDGTKSSGIYTPSPSGGNFRRAANGGAHSLAAPTASGDYTLIVQYTNNASAGAITMTGFSKTSGDAFTTTNGHSFLVFITKISGFTHAHVTRLQ